MRNNEANINKEAFSFIDSIIEIHEKHKAPKLDKGSIAEIGVVDWSDKLIKDAPFFERKYIQSMSDFGITISINGKKYGFPDSVYVKFYQFLHNLIDSYSLQTKVSKEYLKEKTLIWLVNIFRNKKASQDFTSYLTTCLDKDLCHRKFYYPVLNLHIEQPIDFGKIQVTYMTKQYLDNFWNQTKDKGKMTSEEFDSVFRKYQGRVLITVETHAEDNKGAEISYEKACLTIDFIKLFSPTMYFPDDPCLIDLEKRIPFTSEYFSRNIESEFEFKIIKSANNKPFPLSAAPFIESKETISNFKSLFYDTKSELDELIINSIKFLAKAIGENDLHLRITFLIMIIESIFLLDSEDFKMEQKCKRRMCELLFPKNGKKYQEFSETLSNMYSVRHKMTHKSQREFIYMNKLRDVQINLLNTITMLISNKEKIRNKNRLITYLDKKIKTNA